MTSTGALRLHVFVEHENTATEDLDDADHGAGSPRAEGPASEGASPEEAGSLARTVGWVVVTGVAVLAGLTLLVLAISGRVELPDLDLDGLVAGPVAGWGSPGPGANVYGSDNRRGQ